MSSIQKSHFSSTFTEEGLEFCISKVEEELGNLHIILSEKEPNFKTAEEMYLKELNEINTLKSDIEKKKIWLQGLVANRGKNGEKLDLRIMRTTSHNDDKHNKAILPPRESWVIPAAEILEREKRFIEPGILFDMILLEYPKLAKKVSEGYSKGIKIRVIQNFIRSGNLAMSDRKKGIPVLSIWEGKIGLYKWIGSNGPLPNFLHGGFFGGNVVVKHKDSGKDGVVKIGSTQKHSVRAKVNRIV